MNINVLLIDEEYGYQRWINFLTDKEFEEAKRRWKSMKGLNCLVGIQMIFPKARKSTLAEWEDWADADTRSASAPEGHRIIQVHVHECDDSRIEGFDWTIPEADVFEIEGVKYDNEDLYAMNQPDAEE